MKRSIVMIITALIISATIIPTPSFASEVKVDLAENAKSAILIERDTGTVLFEKNSDERLSPASMTKIMTMLLIMEALEDGKIQWNEKVRTSEYAASMGGSQVFLEEGEEMTVDELLRAISISSANDASVAMAERIAGSEKQFVKMMNQKAKELGLKDTKFQNATGLPAKNHYSSARDMAILAKELLKHEKITNYTSQYESYLREGTDKKFWLVNTNRLVKFYPGVDGLKTGFTKEAKYCLTATAKKGDMRVIAVVFGAPTSKERNKLITEMFDYAFSQYETKQFYAKGDELGKVTVEKGQQRNIKIAAGESISLLTKKGEKMDDVKTSLKLNKHIQAPIKKGDEIGKIVLIKNGKVLSENSAIAAENVKPASWWTLYKRSFSMFTKLQ
ncbi:MULTISPECIES: D-alanyl-D-alanine carboxypeptidase family protein [Bacillaceae]|jgi:serine-type D-Ala-D-Ala carboxypeptidase (penicillin-binding protein 5/6)|uniref:serine-type D-Ala-D-Ala carboxypeptidase n=2 Tax=Bacillaceae TaxID=186817 RepID=A0A0D0EQU3_9BACI|nr:MULTISPECIES: D-alanyl-D-alanine carboxypeptidase family protein [Bacillaceae]MCB5933746.1 D-alanyl-D-alanine carboxypeptidase [Bacillus sp. DFI.2.34]NWN96111.1 D-alanyl-D-alanine carboxypeptidase [Bacillus sp. (in: firmicutes)]KIO63026.1 D-alanyl-D-alanine carboxypeptidase [Caldibacillus thermoamylovorans]KIO65542.1 D-alanyl-D-alanine carboxypeptidase [Caldibacillus thermoamylovorans]KIO70428.1 D-alanyl-D-alanine carboxypeptidase [Caldibacillus thermoamylovorans]